MDASSHAFLEALRHCESEPIHTPGSIQPDGALVVVSVANNRVLQVSANVEQVLGVAPQAALGRTLAELVGDGNARRLHDLPVRGDRQPSVPTIFRFDPQQGRPDLAVQVHRVDQDWVIELENCVEADQRHFNQLLVATRDALWESDVECDIVRYCQLIAEQVREVTGFDRAMAYRFDQDWNGEVIAESRNDRLPSLLGHHFPASDIPAQARRLYVRNLVRVLSDVDATPVPLLPATHPDTGEALDMSFAVLRSMSPIHVRYLRNMGARATLSISLMQSGRLWGLIACHHTEPLRVPFQVRELAEFIAKSVSIKLGSLESAERSAFMQQVQETLVEINRRMGRSGDIGDVLTQLGSHILGLLGASGGIIAIGGRRYPFGRVPGADDVDLLVDWLRDHSDSELFHTDCLAADYLPGAGCAERASGLLAVRLDPQYKNYTLWFRPERVRRIPWAGNPEKSLVDDRDGYRLEPRRSFDRWVEEQRGCALPWTALQIESAQALSLTLIEVLTQKALISEAKRSEARLNYLANHDQLTRLPNRLLLKEKLETALMHAEANDEELAVLFIDLDHFKSVNDKLGHLVGDRYLQEVAARLQGSLRHNDILARWGGDEFVAVIERLRGDEAVEEAIHRLSAQLCRPMQLDGHHVIPSASIGVARFPEDGADAVELLQAADAVMYQQKEKKRSGLLIDDADPNESPQVSFELGWQVNRALTESELVMYYQPQFQIEGRTLVGLEALLRWQHPTRGLLMPQEFLPAAEGLGLTREVVNWVLGNVCRQIAEWDSLLPAGVTVAVNAGPGLIDRDFAETVLKAARAECISSERLSIEITEESLERRADVAAALEHLAAAGVALAVDDFGTGYLSLAQLRKLPISCFKIDKEFIDGVPGDHRDEAIVRGVVALAGGLGITTLAEGVENEDQFDFARSAGVDRVQGFYASHPIPSDEVPRYLIGLRQ